LVFLVAAAFISFVRVIAFYETRNLYLFDILAFIAIGLLEFLLTTIPFKTRRLKNGMPSIIKYGTSDIGTYLNISVLLAFSTFSISQDDELVYVIPMFFILICGVSVIFWWRSRVTRKYIEDAKAREMAELQNTIQEKDAELERLRQHNEELSKIIHKDNKLIPAMELAVREHLMFVENSEHDKQIFRGRQLLERLEIISQERAGIVKSYETAYKKLPSTDVLSVDSLMAYMLQKAKAHQISFDLSVSGSVKYLIEHIIDESDLNTLLADLVDNAIIATKQCEKKHIMSYIGIYHDFYRIDIYDSGVPFEVETIADIGLKRTTTHLNDGGSGIGLMTAFEILSKYQASFEIDQRLHNDLFEKKVSVCFDTLGQYRLKSNRDDIPDLALARPDIVRIDERK
jgi:signal transduction histidine kinase